MRHVFLGLAAALAFSLGTQAADPIGLPVELKVLEKFVGTWRTTVEFKGTEFMPEARRLDETKTFEWILKGRCLQETILTGEHEARTVYGYDPLKKAYRCWYFASHGITSEWIGQWHPETNTLRWTGLPGAEFDGQLSTRFLSADRYELTLTVKDKTGKILVQADGIHTRDKK